MSRLVVLIVKVDGLKKVESWLSNETLLVGIHQWLRQRVCHERQDGFGDGNQTRLSYLNQDKNIMLGKENVTFMEIWKGANALIRLG